MREERINQLLLNIAFAAKLSQIEHRDDGLY